jgi:hypothetical protein
VNGGHDALVAGSLECVQTSPVSRQVDRLKDVDTDRRAGGINNQCWVAKTGAPASVEEQSVDVALQPAALEPGELMMVGATWRQGPVRSQALEGPPTPCPLSRRLSMSSTVTYDSLADADSGYAAELAVAVDTTTPSREPTSERSGGMASTANVLNSTNDIGTQTAERSDGPLGASSPVMGLPSEVERR